MLPKETRDYLLRLIKTLKRSQITGLRADLLSLIRTAEGFMPLPPYDPKNDAELVSVLADLTPEELQTVVKSAKTMRQKADRVATRIWRVATL